MATLTPDRLLASVAAGQYGCFTLAQARAAGFSDGAISGRLRSGAWRVLHRGVMVAATTPSTRAVAAVAARLHVGDDAMFSHVTAARLLGVDLRQYDTRIWLRAPFTAGVRSWPGVRVTRSRHEVVPATAHGQPVVPLARTMVDLAQHLDEQEIAGCLYDVIRRQQVSAAEIAAEVEGLRTGVAGLGRLRRVLDSFDPAYDSMVEAVAAAELRAAGIHLTPQVEVWDGPFLVARIDLADEELKFGLEIDGFAYHGTRVAQRRDRSRDRTLHALGWTISRVDALDVLERMPVVVADVARVRARLAAERRRAS